MNYDDESDLIAVGRDAETGRKIYVSKARLQIQFLLLVGAIVGIVIGLIALIAHFFF